MVISMRTAVHYFGGNISFGLSQLLIRWLISYVMNELILLEDSSPEIITEMAYKYIGEMF